MNRSSSDENIIYWLWLQQRLGFASRFVGAVLEQPGSARFIYERTEDDLWALGLFPPYIIKLLRNKSTAEAEQVQEKCLRLGLDILTPDMRLYPKRLLSITDPPAALFVRGDMPNFDQELCIAVVGTRKVSAYGAAMAQDIAGRLTDAGCLVISGAARGIDTAAHQGALISKGGRTAAVLGCGINYTYNMRGAGLRDVIAANGALISEYPPDYPPSAHTFPVRNRLISGISLGVIVVEAGLVSGSINTAYNALHQSRDVFAVAPSIVPYNSEGVTRLLSEGAESISCPLDVLSHYADQFAYKLRITSDCSEDFMHGVTSSSFRGTLNDVFDRFRYRFSGHCAPGKPVSAEEYLPDTPDPADHEDFMPAVRPSGGEEEAEDGYRIARDALISCEYDSADRLIDRLLGSFVPSWRVPVPGGFPDDGMSRKKSGRIHNSADAAEPAGESVETARVEDRAPYDSGLQSLYESSPDDAFGLPVGEDLSEDAARLYGFMDTRPVSADELARLSGIAPSRLLSLLTELELYGLISAHSGKRYSRTG